MSDTVRPLAHPIDRSGFAEVSLRSGAGSWTDELAEAQALEFVLELIRQELDPPEQPH